MQALLEPETFSFLLEFNDFEWCLLLQNKNCDQYSAFQDQDLDFSVCLFPLATWLPQAQFQVQSPKLCTLSVPQIGSVVGVKEIPKVSTVQGSWKRIQRDYGCTVIEISPQLIKKLVDALDEQLIVKICSKISSFCFLHFFTIRKCFYLFVCISLQFFFLSSHLLFWRFFQSFSSSLI